MKNPKESNTPRPTKDNPIAVRLSHNFFMISLIEGDKVFLVEED
jgi:hypothetical protein